MADVIESLWMISWQCALLAGLVWLITRRSGRTPAAWRHALWVVVLVKFFVPPFASLPVRMASQQPASVHGVPAPAHDTMAAAARPSPADQHAQRGAAASAGASEPTPLAVGLGDLDPTGLLALVWLLGVCTMVVRLIIRYRKQRGILKGSSPADSELSGLLACCALRLGVKRLPEIRVSEAVSVPMLLGLVRPTILVRPDIRDLCTESEMSAMVMHELAHVRRWDMAVSWLEQLAQALFFFHPAVWIAGREIRNERELACDRAVLSLSGMDRFEYASGYIAALRLANGIGMGATALAMAETVEMEKGRLEMMLRTASTRMSVFWVGGLIAVAIVGLTTFKGFADGGMPDVRRGARQNPVLAALLQGVTRNYANVQSAQGTFVVQYEGRQDPALERNDGTIKGWSDRYVWSFSRNKFREERIRTTDGNESTPVVASFDGQKAFTWDQSKNYGMEFDGLPGNQVMSFVSAHLGLAFKHGDSQRTWEEMIQETRPQVAGKEVLDDIECYRLKGTSVDGSKHVWWIAPDRGYCVKRHEMTMQPPHGQRVTERRVVMDVSKLTELGDGIWLPTESTVRTYAKLSDGVERPALAISYRSSDLTVNKGIDDKSFTIQFPAGAHVAQPD